MTRPGGLPDRGDHEGVDRHLLVDDPVEGEVGKAQSRTSLLQAELRIEEPLPDEAGDDERHRVGVEEDGAEHALAAHVLIDEHGQQEAEHQAAGDEQNAEDDDVPGGGDEALVAEQAVDTAARPTKSKTGQQLRTGEGRAAPSRACADIDDEDDDGGRQQRERGGQPAGAMRARTRARRMRRMGWDTGDFLDGCVDGGRASGRRDRSCYCEASRRRQLGDEIVGVSPGCSDIA